MKTATAQSFTAEDRRKYIGVSEFGAILGVDKWRTPLDVYNDKLGLVPPFEGNNHTLRGQRLEHIGAELFTEITGRKLRRVTRSLVHPEYDFIRGHIDRLVEGENIVAEIKVVSLASYRKLQREGLPESYILQLNGYIGLGGYKSGIFIIFCPDQFEAISFDVEFLPDIYEKSINAARTFWREHIEPQIPPSFDTPKSDIKFEKIGGQDITFRDDETFTNAAQMLAEAKQILAEGKELEELAKKTFKDAVEDVCGIYEGAGYRVNYTATKGRSSFDKDLLAAENPTLDLTKYTKTGKPGTQITIFKTRTGEN